MKAIVTPVLTHRLVLTPDGRIDGVDPAAIVEAIVGRTTVPTIE